MTNAVYRTRMLTSNLLPTWQVAFQHAVHIIHVLFKPYQSLAYRIANFNHGFLSTEKVQSTLSNIIHRPLPTLYILFSQLKRLLPGQQRYRILPLPRNPDHPGFEILVSKYRALRLLALKSSTQFWSDYEAERLFSEDQWIAKLTRVDAQILVCVKLPDSSSARKKDELSPNGETLNEGDREAQEIEHLLLTQEFVDTLSIVGPMLEIEYETLMGREKEEAEGEKDTRWQIGNLFTHPTYRRQGISLWLGGAAYEYARKMTLESMRHPNTEINKGVENELKVGHLRHGNEQTKMRVRCIVKRTPAGLKLIELYKTLVGMGEIERRCTLKEAFGAIGDTALVPGGWEKMEKWNTRNLSVMEHVVFVEKGLISFR